MGYLRTNQYACLTDLVRYEIEPVLEGLQDFPLDKLVEELRDRRLIRYVPGYGFHIVKDSTGLTPGFWELVEALDGTTND